jgi:hypothetical protein
VWFLRFDKKAFALSVERIDFVPGLGVEAREWKVRFRADHFLFSTFAHNSSASNVPNEMIMGQLIIVKDINKNLIVSNKATSNIWFWKAFIYHRIVIDSK